jgi:hypothetical protein
VCFQHFSETVKATDDPDKRVMFEGMLGRLTKAVEALEKAVKDKNEAGIKEHQAVSFILVKKNLKT